MDFGSLRTSSFAIASTGRCTRTSTIRQKVCIGLRTVLSDARAGIGTRRMHRSRGLK